jgi:plastocyanin
MRKLLPIVAVIAIAIGIGAVAASAGGAGSGKAAAAANAQTVKIPGEDRFKQFALTVHAGDTVQWVNGDEDEHYVVSDDKFNTAGHKGTRHELEPDDEFSLRFNNPGTFVYYCRLHAHLDKFNQPVAPGPDGGIQDNDGNYGTPMSGVITVLPPNGD